MQATNPLLKAPECAAILQVSEPTFWRRVADGTLPKPIKIGHLSRWEQSDILAAIARLKPENNAEAA